MCIRDSYIERAHPDDPTRFEFQGEWEQAQVFREEITVKGLSLIHISEPTRPY